MSTSYDRAFNYVMEIEGILSDHPRDPGGLTAWGLTKRDHPDLFEDGRIPTREEAKVIYVERGYWNKTYYPRFDYEPIALELFEAGVLCGRRTAVMFAQTAHNYLADWEWSPPLLVDGGLGPKTFYGLEELCRRGYGNALYRGMNQEQGERFKQIASPDFIRGWFQKRLN